MQLRIETLTGRKLIGKRQSTSLTINQTFKLWQSFMPRRKEIKNNLTTELFLMQVYPQLFDFTFFNLKVEFEKWAAIEVADFETIPAEMKTYVLTGGLYAVFDYKGLNTDTKIFKYIFGTWLPNSKTYSLDDRPHFEILGDKYKNNDTNSEEEIWIPIRPKE